ncbi:MAG: hypothetical protein Q8O55_06515 [Dehalococcoidales bacterium]|nr:hypothetical protein [Dehalococcoidales bacterium]
MIKTVIRCPNNMVMVFDGRGEQVREYQGEYEEVKESILKNAPPAAVFVYLSDFGSGLRPVPKEVW